MGPICVRVSSLWWSRKRTQDAACDNRRMFEHATKKIAATPTRRDLRSTSNRGETTTRVMTRNRSAFSARKSSPTATPVVQPWSHATIPRRRGTNVLDEGVGIASASTIGEHRLHATRRLVGRSAWLFQKRCVPKKEPKGEQPPRRAVAPITNPPTAQYPTAIQPLKSFRFDPGLVV